MTTSIWIWGWVILAGIAVFCAYTYLGKFYRCFFFSAFTGAAALGALWFIGHFVPINLTLTPLTSTVSLLLGIPGVLSMLILGII